MTKLALVLTLAASVSVWGQDAISAHSGMIHYVEGKALLNGQPVELKFAQFPEVKNDQVLSTEEGRAEVLMSPGVFLRLSENSSFRMVSNDLSDTKIEVVSGDAMIEVDDLAKDNGITVQFLGSSTALNKKGLYRFDADRRRIRVYQGSATVTREALTASARSNKEIQITDDKLTSAFFDSKDTDPFYRWTERRAEYITTANLSAARQAGISGFSNVAGGLGLGGYGSGFYSGAGAWAWNPWYGMFTYVPYNGYGYSPFGYSYYSPGTVAYALPVGGSYGNGSPRTIPVSRAGGTGSVVSGGSGAIAQRATIVSSGPSGGGGSTGGIGIASGTRGGGGGGGVAAAPSVGAGGGASSSGGAVASHGASMGGGGAHK